MTLEELLKGQNLTDEQVTAIIDGMKENKIFTASEENLDIRYGKLKTDHDALAVKDAESQKLIEELQKATKGQDAVQAKITEYEATIARQQEELQQAEKAVKILGGKIQDVVYFNLPDSEIQRSLVVIEKMKPTPGRYPRKAGTPLKEPLS